VGTLSIVSGILSSQHLPHNVRLTLVIRTEFGADVLTSGPASAYEPFINNTWWNDWAQFVVKNDSVPDQVKPCDGTTQTSCLVLSFSMSGIWKAVLVICLVAKMDWSSTN